MVDKTSLEKLLATLGMNGKIIGYRPMNGGVSASMSLANIQADVHNSRKLVIRQLSPEMLASRPQGLTMEYSLLGILHHHKIPVPIPVYLDADGTIFETPTLVLDYLEGELDFSPRLLQERIENLARVVANIHSIPLEEITSASVPTLSFSLEKLIGEIPQEPDSYINEIDLRNILARNWPPPHRNPPALLHGDIWNGNLLWRGDHLAGIIDWEDAWVGDPLLDVAGIRLDLACEFGKHFADLFTSQYQSLRKINLRSLPHWDLVASLWFTRFINEDFVKHPDFFVRYDRPDITLDHFRCVTRQFSQNALAKISS